MNMITRMPPPEAATLTLADARHYVAQCDSISSKTRENYLACLSGIARICCQPASAIKLDCPTLRRQLFRRSPAAWGYTSQRFGKLLSGLRFALRGFGLHASEITPNQLHPAWVALRDGLPKYRQIALSGFIGFCSHRGEDPANLPTDLLNTFECFLTEQTLEPDPAGLARRTASNWNWARGHIPHWAGLPELRRPRMRQHYTLPFSAYPPAFQADVQCFLDRLAKKDAGVIFHDGVVQKPAGRRRRKGASPATVKTRDHQLRQASAALVHTGTPIEDIQSLRDLLVPFERAVRIREFYCDRHGEEPNSQVAGILETLRQVALHHCQLPPEQVAIIANWTSEARPDWQAGMTEHNRRRLRELIQLRPRAMLLHFPRELLRRAQAPTLTPMAAAKLVAYAVALEIELVFPMRRANLAGLRLDQHLQRLDRGRRRVTDIFLSGAEMKNRNGMEWPLPRETSDLIETYLRHHRPHLVTDPANPFLFPGPGTAGRSAHELALGLCGLIERDLGIKLHLHLLRHFGGWVFLQRNPGQYEILRQVLGHKKIEVTIACYTGLEADAAARLFDETVLQERAETRSTARAAFAKAKRKTTRRKPR